MRTLRIGAVAILSLVGLASQPSAGPKLTIKQSTFNFGFVPQNSKVAHVFWLHSTGDDTLKIIDVIPGCGCTKAPLEEDKLPPGDSTRLEVVFDTKNYIGQISKSPRIETNEGREAHSVQFDCVVKMQPDSTRPIIIKPYKLDFVQVEGRPHKEFPFSISNVSDREISMTIVDFPEQFATIDLPRSIKAGETVQGKANLRPEMADKEIEKSFTLQLGDGSRSRFTIPLKRVNIKPSIDSTATPTSDRN